MTHIHI